MAVMKRLLFVLLVGVGAAVLSLWMAQTFTSWEENHRLLRENQRLLGEIHDLLMQQHAGNSSSRNGSVILQGPHATSQGRLEVQGVFALPDSPGVQLPAVCNSQDQTKGALQVICAADPTVVPLRATFASRPVTIWGDKLDAIGHRGAVNEQAKDVYNLKRFCLGLERNEWIADFGSNLGATAVHMRILAPCTRIVALEPSPWNYLLLRLNVMQNLPGDGLTTMLRAGLAAQPGTMRGTHFFGNAWASRREGIFRNGSYIKADPSTWSKRASTTIGPFEAPLLTIPSIRNSLHIDKIGLMKLDCEGCEWEVVSQALKSIEWKMPRKMIGELHATCQYDKGSIKGGNISECLPTGINLEDAGEVWLTLCQNANIDMEWGCDEPRFALLGSGVAEILIKRLCNNPQKVKKWNKKNVEQLCKSRG